MLCHIVEMQRYEMRLHVRVHESRSIFMCVCWALWKKLAIQGRGGEESRGGAVNFRGGGLVDQSQKERYAALIYISLHFVRMLCRASVTVIVSYG